MENPSLNKIQDTTFYTPTLIGYRLFGDPEERPLVNLTHAPYLTPYGTKHPSVAQRDVNEKSETRSHLHNTMLTTNRIRHKTMRLSYFNKSLTH